LFLGRDNFSERDNFSGRDNRPERDNHTMTRGRLARLRPVRNSVENYADTGVPPR